MHLSRSSNHGAESRLAIKTFVSPWSSGLMREAAYGSSSAAARFIFYTTTSTPSAHGEICSAGAGGAHRGRPRPDPERELERVMRDFIGSARRPAVLDHHRDRDRIPTTNTIVINRADGSGSRSSTSCAAARALAPPGVRLPADAARGGAVGAGEKAARGDPDDGGAGLRLLSSRCTTSRSAARARCSAKSWVDDAGPASA